MIIDGKRIKSKKTFDVINPYDNKIVEKVSVATKEDITKAIKLSYSTKKNLEQGQRIEIFKNTAKKIKKQKKEIAKLITSESGLCIKDTKYELNRVINVLASGAKAISKIEEDTTSRYVDGNNKNPKLKVISEPLDLVLRIREWYS